MKQAFALYINELLEWNKKFNLTRIIDPEEIRIKHFEDSLTLLQAIKLTDQTVADVGTGAGFPGIPLKIVCPDIKLTLIEATRKKTEFLKHLVAALNLKDVEIIWGRAEELKDRQFDFVVARAVAKLPKLVEWCLPLVKQGGTFIAMKGQNVKEELSGQEKVFNVSIPGSDLKRALVMITRQNPFAVH